MSIGNLARRFAVTGGLLAGLAAGSVLVAGAADAAGPLTAAPSCVTYTQLAHSSTKTTTVYLHTTCTSAVHVKIIVRHGSDSGCIPVSRNAAVAPFTSHSDDGLQPSVQRLDSC